MNTAPTRLPTGERGHRPAEGQSEHGDRESPGNDGEQHQVRTEPHGEKVARGSMALLARNGLNGADLEPCRLFALCHGQFPRLMVMASLSSMPADSSTLLKDSSCAV